MGFNFSMNQSTRLIAYLIKIALIIKLCLDRFVGPAQRAASCHFDKVKINDVIKAIKI